MFTKPLSSADTSGCQKTYCIVKAWIPAELSSEHAQTDEQWLAEETILKVLRGLKEDLATMFRLETKAL
jgi:hypothetical protein